MVDNGSTDASLELARKEFPQVRIIPNGRNLGFSRGYNIAVPQAKGRLLVFLNNDTEVVSGWLSSLVETLLRRPEAGVVAAKILIHGTGMLNCAGGYLKLWTGCGEIGLGLDEHSALVDKVIEPFYASGAAMALTRELFEKLGGFDDEMFAYGEDLDLCWRARLMGYRIVYAPKSVVYHRFSGTAGILNPWKVGMVTRHQIRSNIRCLSLINLLHSVPAYMLFALAKGFSLSLVTRNPAFAVSVITAVVDSLRFLPVVWKSRQWVQRLRTAPDSKVLSSEDFGLLQSPWRLWQVMRIVQSISRESN